MSQVPNVGDKQRLVGPQSGGGGGALPSNAAPPEVQQSSVIGTSARYARQDHTHQSPAIYWPQSAGATPNVVSNRQGFITVTTPTIDGGTNFGSYPAGYTGPGVNGDFATVSGGYANDASNNYDTVSGGLNNKINSTDDLNPCNAIAGGYENIIDRFYGSVVAGGGFGVINNPLDLAYEGAAGYIGGGFGNQVYLSGGVAHGVLARSYIVGQSSFASGTESGEPSSAQHSKVVVSGKTLGGIANESVVLLPWIETGNVFNLQPNRSYTIEIHAVATRVGSTDQHNWIMGLSLRTDNAGAITIKGQSVIYEFSDAGAADYTLVATGPANDLLLTFRTGGRNIHAVNVCATALLTEVVTTTITPP